MLKLSDTARLKYLPPDGELEESLKKLSATPPFPENLDSMPFQERKAALTEIHDRLIALLAFLREYVALKEVEGWQSSIFHCYTHDDRLVGRVAVNYVNTPRPSIDVGVLPAFRGQGYGCEMVGEAIRAVFRQTDCGHVEYDLAAWNDSSRALALKLGGKLIYKDENGESYQIKREDFI